MFGKENVEYSEIFRFFFFQNFFFLQPQLIFLCRSHKRYYNTWKLNCGPRCYWELGEHFGNTLGTYWEQTTKQKFPPSCPLANQLANLQFFCALVALWIYLIICFFFLHFLPYEFMDFFWHLPTSPPPTLPPFACCTLKDYLHSCCKDFVRIVPAC